MLLTLPIREILPATPRARIVKLDLGDRTFPYAPGQAVLIAAHGAPRRRPYSIAAAPEDAAQERAIELLVGIDETGSAGPHLDLDLGALVDVEGPVGAFTFPERPAERRFLFIAGGTGIAPLRAMLHRALALDHREIGVLYSARTPDEFAYEGELRALARDGAIELRQTITRGAGVAWPGTRGRIGTADLAPLVHATETLCFVCGPPSLVDEIPRLLADLGVEPRRIRLEEWA